MRIAISSMTDILLLKNLQEKTIAKHYSFFSEKQRKVAEYFKYIFCDFGNEAFIYFLIASLLNCKARDSDYLVSSVYYFICRCVNFHVKPVANNLR